MQNETAAQQAVICPRGASRYIWKIGDTLNAIATANGITTRALSSVNPNVDFSKIVAGVLICVPPRPLNCDGGRLYEIQDGDTLYNIATRNNISLAELQRINTSLDTQNMQVGQLICLPPEDESGSGSTGGGTTGGGSAGNGSGGTTGGDSTTGISCPVGYAAKAVKDGQTYADILLENNVSYRAMRLSNPDLVPGQLVVGTQYCAPPSGTRQECTNPYTIQPDETLASLSAKLNVSQGRLLQLNPTLVPTDFSSGTIICIPVP